MYYLYVVIVLLLVMVVLWAILSFHNVLTNQRYVNTAWGRIDNLLIARNELLGYFQELWVRNVTAPERITQLQQLLAGEAALDWADIPTRTKWRNDIETAAQSLFADALSHEGVQKDPELSQLRFHLAENTSALNTEVGRFNTVVATYNRMLRQVPNNFTGQHFGAEPITSFPVTFSPL